jgi:hypothetical protein
MFRERVGGVSCQSGTRRRATQHYEARGHCECVKQARLLETTRQRTASGAFQAQNGRRDAARPGQHEDTIGTVARDAGANKTRRFGVHVRVPLHRTSAQRSVAREARVEQSGGVRRAAARPGGRRRPDRGSRVLFWRAAAAVALVCKRTARARKHTLSAQNSPLRLLRRGPAGVAVFSRTLHAVVKLRHELDLLGRLRYMCCEAVS